MIHSIKGNVSKFKISFCTVCMNRLHHLKKTLPKNIRDNLKYGNVEFVVLNYNSKDDIDHWIKTNMSKYIKNGILKYYKTTEPDSFHHSHAKNVVAKCAEGDIICNIDADNFMGKGFADFVNNKFSANNNIFITVSKGIVTKDCLGRICSKSTDFHKITGYDEGMSGYGFEDIDLINRLKVIGLERDDIDNPDFLKIIAHEDEERLKDDENAKNINTIYIRPINYKSIGVLYLLKDSKYRYGNVLINRLQNSTSIDNIFHQNHTYEYEFSLSTNKWHQGIWDIMHGEIEFDGIPVTSKKSDILKNDPSSIEVVQFNGFELYKVDGEKQNLNFKMFYSQISNRIKMENNVTENRFKANEFFYGKAFLTKNFSFKIRLD